MNARNVAFISRYNPRSRYPLVDDKLKTKMVVRKAGVTVPDLLLLIRTQPPSGLRTSRASRCRSSEATDPTACTP